MEWENIEKNQVEDIIILIQECIYNTGFRDP
jgi:hypothetical protein